MIEQDEYFNTSPGKWAILVIQQGHQIQEQKKEIEYLRADNAQIRIDLAQERHERQMLAQILFAHKEVEDEPETRNLTPVNLTPQEQTTVVRKGVKRGVKLTPKRGVKLTPTRDAILQFYAQIGVASLRKASAHFGVSHVTIKNKLDEKS
jgi:hypothetical protein